MTLIRKDIILKVEGKCYKFGNLGINKNKIEMFYQFPWGSKLPGEQVINGVIEESHLPDHISFHHDGVVHFKYKDNKKRKAYYQDQKLDINPFNLKRNTAHVLLVESVRNVDWRLKTIEAYDPESFVFNLGTHKHFSIVIHSLCEKFNPQYLVSGEWSHLRVIDSALIWQSVFSHEEKLKLAEKLNSDLDTCLCIMFVENVLPIGKATVHEITGEEGLEQFSLTLTPPPHELKTLLETR